MSYKEHRRKAKRYPVRWKAAAVFDKVTGRPVLHTETDDLSVGGGAIRTEYGDLTGSVITLLLAQPPRQAGEQPRMLRIRARVVSSVQASGKGGYRHGLSFIRTEGDGLDSLEDLLKMAAEVVGGAPAAAPQAAPQAAPAAAGGAMGRLAALKQAAQAKLAEEAQAPKVDPQKEREERVSEALKRAYWYFKELVEQLDVVKPAYPSKGYTIAGVPEFTDFAWDVGKVDLRTRETSPDTKLFTRVILDFRIAKQRPLLKVAREYPASEKFKQLLKDYGLEVHTSDTRNERGAILNTTFAFPCQVVAKLELEGNFETGKLLMKTRNVERFGVMDYVIAPEALTQESLEELTGLILGETNRVGPLLLKNA